MTDFVCPTLCYPSLFWHQLGVSLLGGFNLYLMCCDWPLHSDFFPAIYIHIHTYSPSSAHYFSHENGESTLLWIMGYYHPVNSALTKKVVIRIITTVKTLYLTIWRTFFMTIFSGLITDIKWNVLRKKKEFSSCNVTAEHSSEAVSTPSLCVV
jgi:hypothetical protein